VDYQKLYERAFLKPRPKGWRPRPGDLVLYRPRAHVDAAPAVVVQRRPPAKVRIRHGHPDEGRILPSYVVATRRPTRALTKLRNTPTPRLYEAALHLLRPHEQKISRDVLLTLTIGAVLNAD
jgi:hypothetical protein